MGTRTVDLALSEFLAKQLKTTSVLDTDLGLVGMLLDGEGFYEGFSIRKRESRLLGHDLDRPILRDAPRKKA